MSTGAIAERAPDATAPTARTDVYQCIVGVSAELAREGIAKTRKNAQQGYEFRGIEEVMNALAPLLARYGLVILPRMLSRELTERVTKNGGVLFSVTVEAEFDFVSAADGSKHTVKTYGEAMDSADKATNKAMSAAYKYAAFQTFCIPTEGDNDADAHTHEIASRTPALPEKREKPAAATVGDRGPSHPDDWRADLEDAGLREIPQGFALIDDYKPDGEWHHITWGRDLQGGWQVYKTKIPRVAEEAIQAFRDAVPVKIHSKKYPWLDRVERLQA